MLNWKLIDKTYLYDGTFDGLLTIVFDCYASKTLPIKIVAKEAYCSNLLDYCMEIQTDFEKAKRVLDGIFRKISYDVWYDTYFAFLRDEVERELDIIQYLCLAFQIGPEIKNMLAVDYILDTNKRRKRVSLEIQKLKGFTRFIEIGNNLYFAKLQPDNNIIEILGHHFVQRFPTQSFILVDQKRDLAFLYNQKEHTLLSSHDITMPEITENEKELQELWKLFVQTIGIPERKNSRLQLQFMPKRYWKDLIEI